MWEWRTTARSPTAPGRATEGAVGSLSPSGMTDREEVQRLVEPLLAQREVLRGDRGHVAVVEGLGDPQRAVDAVPPGAHGELVGTRLARVEEAEDLDAREVGREHLAVLRVRVL